MGFQKDWLLKMDVKGGQIEPSSQLISNVLLFHDNMVHHESLLQWYRVFFLTFEAAIFAMVFFLIGNSRFYFIPGIFGVFGCILWWFVCTQRISLIDKQLGEIRYLLSNSELKRWYEVYIGKKRSEKPRTRRLAQIVFNIGLPATITALWFILLTG